MSKSRGVGEAKPGIAGKAFPAVKAEAKKETDRVVSVRAKRMGYYGNARKRPGEVFDIVLGPAEKLPSWVVDASAEEPAQAVAASASSSEDASGDSSGDVL